MPYTPINNLSRRGEKIAPFLTVQNVIGLIVGLVPTWLALAAAPPLIRTGAALLAALIGYAVTLEWQGLSVAERLLWLIRGAIRSALRGGRPIEPSELPLGAASGDVVALQYGGAVSLLGEDDQDVAAWDLPRLDDDAADDDADGPRRPAPAA